MRGNPRVHLGREKKLVIVGADQSERKELASLCKENILSERIMPPNYGLTEALEGIQDIVCARNIKCLAVIFSLGGKEILPASFFNKVKRLCQQFPNKKGEPRELIIRILVIGPPRRDLSALSIQLGADDYLIRSGALLVKFLREKLNLLMRLRRKGDALSGRGMIEKGRRLADEGQYEKALKYYIGAHGLKEGNATIKFLLGGLYEEYGGYLERRHAAGGEGITMAEKIVFCYSEAIRWYTEAIRANSLFIKPLLALSELCRKQGFLVPEALILKKLETASLGSPDAYYRMGRNRLEQGNAEEALYFFGTAISRVDEINLLGKADLHRKIALTYFASRRLGEAEENFRRALYFMKESERMRKKDVTLKYKKVGDDQEGHYEEPPLVFEQRRVMVRIHEDLMRVVLERAETVPDDHEVLEEIIKLGKEALDLNPVAENIWELMGKAYEAMGRPEEAAESYYHYRFFSSAMDMGGDAAVDAGLAW